MRPTPLHLAISALLLCVATPAVAQSVTPPAEAVAESDETNETKRAEPAHPERLDTVIITSSALRPSGDQIIAPVAVLQGAELDDRKQATLGETVAGIAGVQSSYFGPGVGRPIIRGMDGPRVSVLSNGLGSADVSNVSQDHAVSIEPFLADQIEVLKGPNTLLYGPSAIGGIVNVIDGRIPESAPANGFSGRAEMNLDSVSDGRSGMMRVDAGNENYAIHADGLLRKSGDYNTPLGRIDNSGLETRTGAVGGSVFGDWGFAGASVSRFLSDYGVPGHSHGGHDHEGHDHDHDHDEDHEHSDDVTIGMQQTRHDLKMGLNTPFAGVEVLRVGFSDTRYAHTEFEGTEIGTQFSARTQEARLEMVHQPWAGWRGAFGMQASRRDFKAEGEEAFVPPTLSRNVGIFLAEQRQWDRLSVELGARADRNQIDPRLMDDHDHDHEHAHDNEIRSRRFTSRGMSFGAGWRLNELWHLNLNLDRAQRAPVEEELFANGAHVATRTWEIGDAQLGTETANQFELGLHFHGERVEAKVAGYSNRYNDYIHLAATGAEEHGFPVRQWSQADARFHGFEAEATIHLVADERGQWDLRIWGDTIRARLADGGGNLPRIPAARLGSRLSWSDGVTRASVGATHYFEQNDVAAHETATGGFTLIDARVAWSPVSDARTNWEVYASGNNLGNATARMATSWVKDVAPLPGRSLTVGLRAFF